MRVPAFLIVCASLAIIVPAFAVETTPQPLTRADCEKAGMQWNDNANVCGGNQAATKREAKPEKSKKKGQ
jgi:hypothetical protein